jgi:hypothetical protein
MCKALLFEGFIVNGRKRWRMPPGSGIGEIGEVPPISGTELAPRVWYGTILV